MLNETEKVLIAEWKGKNVLKDVSANLEQEGVILVCCSDGHRFGEMFCHLQNFTEHIHALALNGGALGMGFPIKFFFRKRALRRNIQEAVDMKGWRHIVVSSHWPCGIAIRQEMTLPEVLKRTVNASNYIKTRIRGENIEVFPHLHIDFRILPGKEKGNQRTYEICHHRIKELVLAY